MGARILSSVFSFVAGIITARDLGTHGRAMLAVAIAIPAIFGVFGVLGLDNANARFAGRSHSAFRQVLRRSVAFSAVGGSAMAGGWALVGMVWPASRLGLDLRLTLISAAICPVSLLFNLLGSAEVGRGRVGTYNIVTIGSAATYLVGVLLLLASGRLTVAGCTLACAAGQLLGVVLLLILAITRVHPDGDRVSLRRYTSYAFRAYLPNLAHYGMLRMDVPIIQALAGTTAVALYAVGLPIAEGVMLMPTAVALVLFPRVTAGAVGQDSARRISRVVLIGSIALAVLAALASPVLIPVIYGAPYSGATPVVWSMLPGLVLLGAARTQQAYLAATDKLNLVIVATLAGFAAGLVGLTSLTPRLGATGAGIADSVGYLAFSVTILASIPSPGARGSATRSWRAARRHAHSLRTVIPRIAARPVWLRAAAISAGLLAAAASAYAGSPSGVLTVAAMLVVLAVPSAGLFALAVACPLSQTSFASSLISERALLVLIIMTAASRLATGRFARPSASAAALAISACSYFLLSATLIGGAGADHNWHYVMMLGVPLLLLPLTSDGDTETRQALVVFGFSSALLALIEIKASGDALAASAGQSEVNQAVAAAINTGAVNHNAEGAVFVLALAVMLARLTSALSSIQRLMTAVAAVALVVGIAYSFSRSAYFGAFAVVLLFAIRRSIRWLSAVAAAVACVTLALPSAVGARFASALHPGNLDISSALRLDLWSSALRMFSAHPFFGVGYLNFPSQLPYYYRDTGDYSPSAIQFANLQFAHNTYLTILAVSGLAGAVLIGALVVIGCRRAWAAAGNGRWTGDAALLGLAGVGVCSVFGEVLLVLPIFTIFLLALLAPGRTERGRR